MFQNIFTPGGALYWAMIILPNVMIILFSLLWSRRHRAFLLVIVGALLNVAVPYASVVISNRGTGLNAPGTPEWVAWLCIGLWTNQGTLVLVLALLTCILVSNKSKTQQFVEQKDRRVVSESAPSASSEKPSS